MKYAIALGLLFVGSLQAQDMCDLVEQQSAIIQQQLDLCSVTLPPTEKEDPGKGVWIDGNVKVFDLASSNSGSLYSNRTYIPGCIWNTEPASKCKTNGSAVYDKVYAARVPFSRGTVKYVGIARAEAGENSAQFNGTISDSHDKEGTCKFSNATQILLTIVDQTTYENSQWGDFNIYEGACVVPDSTSTAYFNLTPSNPKCGMQGFTCRTQVNEL